MHLIPADNERAYALLFQIENTLRVFIISRLETQAGQRWFKSRLPADLLKKYKNGVTWERNIRWQELRPHHPLFYLDFPDLRKIIERHDNWADVFSSYFGNKDLFLAHLEALDLARNRVAHNRYLGNEDVQRLETFASMLSSTLSDFPLTPELSYLAPKSIPENIRELHQAATSAMSGIEKLEKIQFSTTTKTTLEAWWFEDVHLGHSVSATQKFFSLAERYTSLPRLRGTGHTLEKWTREHDLQSAYNECNTELTTITRG